MESSIFSGGGASTSFLIIIIINIIVFVCPIIAWIIFKMIKRKKIKRQKTADIAIKILYGGYNKCENFAPSENPYVFFDLETTGLKLPQHRIVQIAAIKYQNGKELERFSSYVNPGIRIPKEASRIHHIYNHTVKNAPGWLDVAPKFFDFIGDSPLIAHNSGFDMLFIQTLSSKKINNPVYDTLNISRKFLNLAPNHKLETLKNIFNIEAKSHDAMGDCEVTAFVYEFCRKKFEHLYEIMTTSYQEPCDPLDESEQPYYDEIYAILKESGEDTFGIYGKKRNGFITVKCFKSNICTFKIGKRLKYLLFDMPIDEFSKSFQTKLTTVLSSKSEGNKTRVILEEPDNLRDFKIYFINCLKNALITESQRIEDQKIMLENNKFTTDFRFN